MKYNVREEKEKRENFEQMFDFDGRRSGTAQISIFDGSFYYKTIKTKYHKRKRDLNNKTFKEAFLSIEKEINFNGFQYPRIKISFEYSDGSRIKILEIREYVFEKIDD